VATESRAFDPYLEHTDVENRLSGEPQSFEFFQALRLLERLSQGRTPVGGFANPATEVVRLAAHNSLAFPPSQIHSLEWREDQPPRMTVNFMGLTGPEGVLPLYYTQLIAERIRARDTALRDFLDIFNHRIISLFYRAWEKYRFTIEFERGERDRVFQHLLDLIGVGTPGLQGRQPVPDHSLVYYAGLLAQKPRSAEALRLILMDYFEVPVEIEQFAGAWFPLDLGTQCCLRDGRTSSEQLGYGAIAGDEIWSEQSRVRIRMGPLTLEQYRDFLPSGTAYEPLRAITKFFSGDEMDFDVQLILRREDTPGCELGAGDEQAPKLGWISWMNTAGMNRDPDETVLQL
jgi:type VI secretion system protein ImpH